MTNLGALASNATIPASALGDDVLPLGSVIDWYRVTTATTVPAGWAVCDGSLWNDLDNQMGSSKAKLTTGNIPDLTGKVTVGARLTTTAGGLTAADGAASANGNAYANAPGRHLSNDPASACGLCCGPGPYPACASSSCPSLCLGCVGGGARVRACCN